MMIELVSIALAAIHFGLPVGYYYYAKRKWLPERWNINVDENYSPKVTVMIPTYDEAHNIINKLDNLYSQEYLKHLVEVVVVDSGSKDETQETVERWRGQHTDIALSLINEPVRRGMVPALNFALKSYSSSAEMVLFTDADAVWGPYALRNIVKYFADPTVGAVTSSVTPIGPTNESVYRGFYNSLRVAESKVHSTPVHNASGLVAFRKDLINVMEGLPTYTGNNDSTPASVMAFMGYRAIQVEETVGEPTDKWPFHKKVRRAQHLLLGFLMTKRYVKRKSLYRESRFDMIWMIEWYLHVANPWLLLSSAVALAVSVVAFNSTLALLTLLTGVLLLASSTFRMWILQQIYLAVGLVRCLWTRDIVWRK